MKNIRDGGERQTPVGDLSSALCLGLFLPPVLSCQEIERLTGPQKWVPVVSSHEGIVSSSWPGAADARADVLKKYWRAAGDLIQCINWLKVLAVSRCGVGRQCRRQGLGLTQRIWRQFSMYTKRAWRAIHYTEHDGAHE